MQYFITGGAGFIGSNIADRLLGLGHQVTVYDNLSTGLESFLAEALTSANFRFVHGDVLDSDALKSAMQGAEFVFHISANADVRFGTKHPRKDLEQNTIATYNVLEAMRAHGVRRIAFSSTGSVYGEATVFPTPEDAPFPIQTSLYGASKLACEALIAAYVEGFGFEGRVFRFVSLLGERYTHGHVIDFFRQLKQHPQYLNVLGDGSQRKSYLYVQDCIDVMLRIVETSTEKLEIVNLGTAEYCAVSDSIGWICEAMGVTPDLRYSGGKRGWIGDNPFIFLDTKKAQSFDWKPRLTIREAILKTVAYLEANPDLWVAEPEK